MNGISELSDQDVVVTYYLPGRDGVTLKAKHRLVKVLVNQKDRKFEVVGN